MLRIIYDFEKFLIISTFDYVSIELHCFENFFINYIFLDNYSMYVGSFHKTIVDS